MSVIPHEVNRLDIEVAGAFDDFRDGHDGRPVDWCATRDVPSDGSGKDRRGPRTDARQHGSVASHTTRSARRPGRRSQRGSHSPTALFELARRWT